VFPEVVALEVGLLREGLPAQRIHVLALVDVGLHVHLEVELARKRLLTHLALEALDFAVLFLQK